MMRAATMRVIASDLWASPRESQAIAKARPIASKVSGSKLCSCRYAVIGADHSVPRGGAHDPYMCLARGRRRGPSSVDLIRGFCTKACEMASYIRYGCMPQPRLDILHSRA